MAEFTRKLLREIFEGADMEVPPKDVLGKICDLHEAANNGMAETIKDLQGKLRGAATQESDKPDDKAESSGDDYKAKYEAEKKAFADYKADQTAKETKAAKEKAVKAYFEGKNITGANLDIAMRGCRDEIGAIELDGDKIKDTAALDALVNGTFAGLVVTKTVHGAQTANPPANNGGKSYKTKEEILAIKDRAERQTAIAENHEMFGF